MNLSNDTLNVLKNFATINPNLVFKPGLKLKTISFIIEGTILMYFYNLSASTLLRVGRLHI